jgi:hypothetical protein
MGGGYERLSDLINIQKPGCPGTAIRDIVKQKNAESALRPTKEQKDKITILEWQVEISRFPRVVLLRGKGANSRASQARLFFGIAFGK